MWIKTLLGSLTAMLLGVVVLLLLPLPLPESDKAALSFGPMDVRDAAHAGDMRAMTAGLDRAQAEFLAGARSADDLRATYVALSRSHPDMTGFVAAWAEAEPGNPHALISRAWSLYNTAQQICCEGNAHADPVRARHLAEAGRLALRAYELAPDLLPASDAMLRRLAPRSQAPARIEVLDAVLRETPNLGSIERGIGVLRGKSVEVVQKACTAFAKDFDNPAKAIRFCVMQSALHNGPEALRSQQIRSIWEPPWDRELTLERLDLYLHSERFLSAKEGHFMWIRHVLMSYEADQFELVYMNRLARIFEKRLQSSHQKFEYPHRDFLLARQAQAEQFLETDPFNVGLIDMVDEARAASQYTFVDLDDGRHRFVRRDDLDKAQIKTDALALARARVQASPYEAEAWSDYARQVGQREDPISVLEGDAAMENAIAYARDPRPYLGKLMVRKAIEYRRRNMFGDPTSEAFIDTPAWRTYFAQSDPSIDFRCPFLRAELTLALMCDGSDDALCDQEVTEHRDLVEAIRTEARADEACASLLDARAEDLWYEPVDFRTALHLDRDQASASSSSSP